MRPLIIDDDARAKAAGVLAHAEQHHYRPGPGVRAPGDDNRFVAKFGTYRTVFSYTHFDGMLWRHLSVSVPSQKYAHPAAVFMIAELFGFTGYDPRFAAIPGKDWLVDVGKNEHCIVVAQPLKTEAAKSEIN